MSPTFAEILKPTIFAARIVWFALTTAVPVYVAVAYFAAQGGGAPSGEALLLTTACGVLATALALIALTLPRFFPGDDLIRRLVATDPGDEALARSPRSGVVDPQILEALGQLDAGERRLLQLRPIFITQSMVRAALAETIALLGFVLTYATSSFTVVLPFAAASLALQLATMPRFEPLSERAASLMDG